MCYFFILAVAGSYKTDTVSTDIIKVFVNYHHRLARFFYRHTYIQKDDLNSDLFTRYLSKYNSFGGLQNALKYTNDYFNKKRLKYPSRICQWTFLRNYKTLANNHFKTIVCR